MAKKKLSKEERAAWEKDLAILRNAVAQCEQTLKDDDEAAKAGGGDDLTSAVKTMVEKGTGDGHQAIARGVLAIREAGGRRGGPEE